MRVFAVTRQSRGDDKSQSVAEQERRIREWAEREGHELVGLVSEQDVSGGRPLARRPGLRAAVEAVEAGQADAVAVAYFDRLVRSLVVQAEVVERVEKASGRVATLDVGEVSYATAGGWLSSTMLGAVAEYHRRTTSERVKSAHQRLAAEGKWRGGKVPVGLALEDGRLTPGKHASAVLEAYHLRERGASFEDVRAFLRRDTGLELRSLNIVQRILGNEVYVELGVVPPDLYRRVSRLKAPRGRRPSSDRLLARLGVLRCASCGSRMVVASATGSRGQRVPVYRCPPGNGCTSKQSITARIVEERVVSGVARLLADVEGRASIAAHADEAERELDKAELELDAAVRAFSGLEDVDAARGRLLELRQVRDAARDRVAELRAAERPALTIHADRDWELLTRDERRALVRATVDRVEVGPGRGADRVVLVPRGE